MSWMNVCLSVLFLELFYKVMKPCGNLVEALCYEPEGYGFSGCFQFTYSSPTIWPQGFTQPLAELSTRNFHKE